MPRSEFGISALQTAKSFVVAGAAGAYRGDDGTSEALRQSRHAAAAYNHWPAASAIPEPKLMVRRARPRSHIC